MFEETRIIYDTGETHQLARDLIKEAQSEVLVLFSSENSFKRQFKAKNDQLVLEAARRGIIVTVLAPMDESMRNEAEKLEEQNKNLIMRNIRSYSTSLGRPFTSIVVDKKHSLAIELKDDSRLTVEDAIGQAIYSTSKRTVEDSIFRFDVVLKLFQDENESIKRWLSEAVKIVHDNKHPIS